MGQSESNFVLKSDFHHKFKDDDVVECFDEFGIILYTGSFKDLPDFNHKLGVVEIQKVKNRHEFDKLENSKVKNKNQNSKNDQMIFVDIGASFSDCRERKKYQIKS